MLALGSPALAQTPIKMLPYPQTRKVDTVTTYFGTKVADPYRWLENDQAADTKSWVQDENKVTQGYLAQIPFREAIRKRLETLWNYEKYGAPFKEGKYTYFSKNTGLQSQSVVYRQLGSTGARRCFWTPTRSRKPAPPRWPASTSAKTAAWPPTRFRKAAPTGAR